MDARSVLRRALDDRDDFARSHAIEALAETMGAQSGPTFAQALSDASPAVRFAAAMAIGDAKYAPAKDRLLRMSQDKQLEPDRRVMPAVIYALFRLGNDTYAGDLYALLFDKEKEVRSNAALAMGRMQEVSAIGPLQTRLAEEQESQVRLQIIEALAVLGEEASALSLESYTKKTPFLDERLVAIPAMAKVRSSTAPLVLRELLDPRQPPRVRAAAAGALAMLGEYNAEAYEFCLDAARDPEGVTRKAYGRSGAAAIELTSLQQLAAIALGWMNNEGAVNVLHPLLGSPDSGVRIAAGMSILRLLSAYQEQPPPAAVTEPPPPAPPAPSAPARRQVSQPATRPATVPPVATPKRLVVGTREPATAPALVPPAAPLVNQPATRMAVEETKAPGPLKPALRTSGGKD
jgi:HEAT repeat protein